MYENEFAVRLAKLRLKKGVSARDMSLSIGQNPGYINSIENGKSLPSMAGFFFICEYLDITPDASKEALGPKQEQAQGKRHCDGDRGINADLQIFGIDPVFYALYRPFGRGAPFFGRFILHYFFLFAIVTAPKRMAKAAGVPSRAAPAPAV